MAFGSSNPRTAARAQTTTAAYDEGLRAYMLRVYNYMTVALAMTGVIAYAVSVLSVEAFTANGIVFTTFGQTLFLTPLFFIVMLAPLGLVVLFSFRIHKMSASSAQMVFWAFAALMGISLSSIFIQYTGASVARVFFITAATFGAMSLYGYTTKRDLTSWGQFLFIGLIGLIIAIIVNIFVGSSALQFAISVIGVIIFVGLTAYDTQRIKETYSASMDGEMTTKTAIFGALKLYLDFINLFIMLMSLLGNNR